MIIAFDIPANEYSTLFFATNRSKSLSRLDEIMNSLNRADTMSPCESMCFRVYLSFH